MLLKATTRSLLAAAAFLARIAVADNCGHTLYYCGSGLLAKGNYYSDIVNSLAAAGQPNDASHVEDSLFYCAGDDDIPWTAYCSGGCQDGGSGTSDHC